MIALYIPSCRRPCTLCWPGTTTGLPNVRPLIPRAHPSIISPGENPNLTDAEMQSAPISPFKVWPQTWFDISSLCYIQTRNLQPFSCDKSLMDQIWRNGFLILCRVSKDTEKFAAAHRGLILLCSGQRTKVEWFWGEPKCKSAKLKPHLQIVDSTFGQLLQLGIHK